ncbi:aldehyde dehydrogenase [Hyaloscypha finlandica]|nr:aldehyde dehydrogenase [Hyaloscypha finlandica]
MVSELTSTVTLTGIAGHKLELPTGLFINNQFVPSKTHNTLETLNPATGEQLAVISAASPEDVDLAVQHAKTAFKEWRKSHGPVRQKLLLKLADLIERDADELATIDALDAGKIFGESRQMDVPNAVEHLRYFAGWADKIDGKSLRIPNGFAWTQREPIGVCATIVPWNAPLMITIWKLAPAIAAGNVLIIKTAELTPLYGIKLAQLVLEAGFPAGVIQILTGLGTVTGKAMSQHMEISKLAFTGSGAVGRQIMIEAARSNLKKVTLELGGKSPSIIFDDADLENAVFWAVIGITAHNGQICVAGSRLYVQKGIYDKFVEKFREMSLKAVAGDPLLQGSSKGPVISKVQHEKILGHIQKGVEQGAKLLYGGKEVEGKGNFVENTVFVDVGDEMSMMQEEIFGPVAAITKFETEEEVIEKANNSSYGLSSAVFTNDVSRAQRVSHALEAGQVTVNSWAMLNPNTPFGGVKESGFGRDMGEDALDGWTVLKTVKIAILPGKL